MAGWGPTLEKMDYGAAVTLHDGATSLGFPGDSGGGDVSGWYDRNQGGVATELDLEIDGTSASETLSSAQLWAQHGSTTWYFHGDLNGGSDISLDAKKGWSDLIFHNPKVTRYAVQATFAGTEAVTIRAVPRVRRV